MSSRFISASISSGTRSGLVKTSCDVHPTTPINDALAGFPILPSKRQAAFAKIAEAVTALSRETRAGESIIEGLEATAEVASKAGVSGKKEFVEFAEKAGHMVGKSVEELGASVKIVGETGAQEFEKIYQAAKALPKTMELHVLPGVGSNIAVIGRSMDEIRGAQSLLAKQSIGVEIFDGAMITEGARTEFDGIIASSRGGRRVGDDVLMGTKMYRENLQWVQKLKDQGYTIIDLGNSGGRTQASVFYDAERNLLFGGVRR